MYRSFVPKGWTRAVVHLSDEAKAYKRAVGWIAKAAGFRQPTSGPVALRLTLVPRNRVVMDLSNCLKIAEDALQGIVYENDKQVRSISIAYGDPDGKGALIVDVAEFIPTAAPLFAEAAA
jgi:crossover junction endodeoxyribonuclease RusA